MNAVAISPQASQAHPLTSAPVTFAGDPATTKSRTVRVWATRKFHLRIGDTATTADSAFAGAGDGALIRLAPGEGLASIKADDQPDGVIWFTVVTVR